MKDKSTQDLQEELRLLREQQGPARERRDALARFAPRQDHWLAIDKCAALAARAEDIAIELAKRSRTQVQAWSREDGWHDVS